MFTTVINSKWFSMLKCTVFNEQHGFRSGRSTVTYLAISPNKIF